MLKKTFIPNKKVIVILGATATGKSSLAIKIAKKIDSEIISADSRQIYKGLDIGTGKVTKKEMQNITHHGFDIASPKKRFTVVEYKKYAEKKIKEIISRGKTPILCGGTGFYIDTVVNDTIFPQVKPNLKLRKKLEKKDLNELLKILKKLDKNRLKTIDTKNKVRLIRAIEIATTLGKVPKITQAKPVYNFIKIGLVLPLPELERKIKIRVKKMFDKKNSGGLLKEIENLKKSGITKKRLKEFGFEYNDPTLESVTLKSLQYAKRQNTWFKRDKEIIWFESSLRSFPKIMELVKSKLHQ